MSRLTSSWAQSRSHLDVVLRVFQTNAGECMAQEETEKSDNGKQAGGGLAVGIAIGAAVGVGLGAAMGNMGAGIAIGIGLGVSLGLLLFSKSKRK